MSRVEVRGVPSWVPHQRLLGPGDWALEGDAWTAEIEREEAADLAARLRNLGLGGQPLEVRVRPALKRPLIRAARTEDARRRRDSTPGFTRKGTQLDEEGRWSLTPEALALALAQPANGKTVVDAGCGAGGNAIGFARAGARVIAIEQDRARLAMARNNARVYGVERRIHFVHGDLRELLPAQSADLVFVDPPWGTDYDKLRCTAADFPWLGQIRGLATRSGARELWAKLPPSFAPETLPGAVPEAWFGEASGDNRRVKFLLLRVPLAPEQRNQQ